MRLSPDQRKTMVDAVKRGERISTVARVFGVTPRTVRHWYKRSKHVGREYFKDKPRGNPKPKVTIPVELSILSMRTAFKWGTARIQQGLYKLPDYMLETIPDCVQGLDLSRDTINKVLRKHKLNGYQKESKSWKFFRAEYKDQLWQLDLKGPFHLNGKKYWFIVCIDDHSRYLVLCEQFDHCPTTEEITELLDKLDKKPEKILTDNGSQFKDKWKKWCKVKDVKALFAHPYYPQDKGKVERTIRNIGEEFVNLLRKFPEWIEGKIRDYREWYNCDRYHRGIKGYPAVLYLGS